jgi:diguanylate cyclase (GGDEF)-like protein/PAS domain S-box-containing protein
MNDAAARTLRSRLWSPWLVGALASAILQSVEWSPTHRLDLATFDLVAPFARPPALDDTVVVAIDDASIAALGAWPWSRGIHAAMVDRLHDAGVAAIGYDVLFSEPSTNDAAGDDALVAALHRNGRVVLPVAPTGVSRGVDAGVAALEPLPTFIAAARSLGHVDVEVDADAIARRIFLEAGVDTPSLLALPAAVAVVRDGDQARTLAGRRAPAQSAARAAIWTRDFEMLVPHSSAAMPTLSFVDVLRDPTRASSMRNKTIFVGVTATGIGPELTTTISDARAPMPAVDFLAWTYIALRSGTAITPLGLGPNMALALIALVALAIWAPRLSRASSIAVGAMVGLPLAVSVLLLHAAGLWFAPVSATAGLLVGNLLWRGDRLRESARQLFRTKQVARATLHAIADGVITVDETQRILYANPVAQQLIGSSDLQDRTAPELFAEDPPHRQLVATALQECMTQRGTVRVGSDLTLSIAGGSRLVRVTASPLMDSKDRLEGAVLVLHDVTEAAAAAARLDHAATHDGLTGLPNRVLFRERLAQAIAESKRSGETVAALFMDLDRFKRINDSLGHRAGDQVLKVIADRLRSGGRAGDAVARWGGDEFVVLLQGLPSREAIASAARRLMNMVAQTIDLDGMELHCSCSLGIALAPQDASDVDSLLAMADLAMYRGRAQSGGHLEFYASEMALWTRDRLQLESDLRKALVQGEFEIHYQPQVNLTSGEAVGLEALLRWRKAFGEIVMPDEFIGVAEESGLILPIGEWVIFEAAEQIARWSAAGLPALPVAVNVSARQCLDHGIVRTMREALKRTGIEPHLLTLEITESTAMRDVEHVIELFGQISALGIGIAVDDFGTGYSSLSYLKRFPINQLKIDQSFVRDVTTDSNDAAIVVAILALAHSLGWPVVAEGVESEAQRTFLKDQGCELGQGYLFCKPLIAAELEGALHWHESPNVLATESQKRESRITATPLK